MIRRHERFAQAALRTRNRSTSSIQRRICQTSSAAAYWDQGIDLLIDKRGLERPPVRRK